MRDMYAGLVVEHKKNLEEVTSESDKTMYKSAIRRYEQRVNELERWM